MGDQLWNQSTQMICNLIREFSFFWAIWILELFNAYESSVYTLVC